MPSHVVTFHLMFPDSGFLDKKVKDTLPPCLTPALRKYLHSSPFPSFLDSLAKNLFCASLKRFATRSTNETVETGTSVATKCQDKAVIKGSVPWPGDGWRGMCTV